jgi:G:T-mismatch repair DNA endonuclease (very short patch repair protein)
MKRDRKAALALRKENWSALVIWECELRAPEKVERKLKKFLGYGEANLGGLV